MLHRPPAQVRTVARQMAQLGADRVRITAGWSVLAPAPRSRRKPRGAFKADDSRTYDQERWRALDTAVKATVEAGLKPQLDIAFWAPRWAVAKGERNKDRQRFIPHSEEFGRFAHAVAHRYSGRFRDLPAVRMYTTWNEPNEPSFLTPQWKRDSGSPGGWRPFSPHVYRAMHEAAYAAIKSVSAQNLVLIGGTSSKGSTIPGRGGVPPLQFLRTMACVDDLMRPLAVRECAKFKTLQADGYAHHPYSLDTAPGATDPDPDDAPIGDLGRLSEQIKKLTEAGRIAGRWPLYLTEYGYETREHDPFNARFDSRQQAAYLGWSSFLAWRQHDVPLMGQFLLRDIDPADSGFRKGSRRSFRDWQTGLYDHAGRPKPAAQAFRIPFWAQLADGGGGPVLLLWGGVRPGASRRTVRVERLVGDEWVPIRVTNTSCGEEGTFLTDASGYFLRVGRWEGPGRYRLGWQKEDGGRWEYGADVDVGADQPIVVG